MPAPAEATQAAPMLAIDASWAGRSSPCLIRSTIVSAAVLPMTPDGIPVRGGEGAMTRAVGALARAGDLVRRREGDADGEDVRVADAWYVLGQSAPRHSS